MNIMKKIYNYLPRVASIQHTRFNTTLSFMEIAQYISSSPGTVALISGTNLDSARYNILAANPLVEITNRGNHTILKNRHSHILIHENPLQVLNFILKTLHIKDPFPFLPITWGMFGYLSYELKHHIERLPQSCIDDLKLPYFYLMIPEILVIEDRRQKDIHLIIPQLKEETKKEIKDKIILFQKRLLGSIPSYKPFTPKGEIRSNFTREKYIRAIEKIKEYIVKGDVYQVNLSQRFEVEYEGCEFHLFKMLFQRNPAPFFSYINIPPHKIISTSPERFLFQKGEYIETRPIKGTRPRGRTTQEDSLMKEELINSKKDDAELSMIVDLLRNDIGKICRPGTVKVIEHKRVEQYENVYHLVSIVKGKLRQDILAGDIIKATFPGGSITGCPKIRAMEIIDEIEPHTRGVYTGSIGYISFHNSLDLSIAIRTAVTYQNKLTFSVGGGIVFDSDPSLEYEETLHKGKSFLEIITTNPSSSKKSPKEISLSYVWQNGHFVPVKEAYIPITSLSFQYGMGVFETLLGEHGKIFFMDEHIKRMKNAWKRLFNIPLPEFFLPSIVERLIELNGLRGNSIAIKILACLLTENTPLLIVSCRKYIPRTLQAGKKGIRMEIYPFPRHNPLADYKTMNYLYYQRARSWAHQKGADEALILNYDGSISEGNSSNFLLIRGKKIILPKSPHVLKGIMQEKVIDFLMKKNYKLEHRLLFPHELSLSDIAIITNSLIGAMPVERIGEIYLNGDSFHLSQEINKNLLGRKIDISQGDKRI